jgi:hypothetical protein
VQAPGRKVLNIGILGNSERYSECGGKRQGLRMWDV